MNYRHGYHAGNHTEVFKHAALVVLVEALRRKNKPFMVLDTHSGAGLHALGSEMALKTGEADAGIRRIAGSVEPALSRYLDLVRAVGGREVARYPGSPEIVRRLMRADDRLVACELHPEEVVALRSNMAGDPRVSVHHRNGYEAIGAFVPPPQRRGLVFIDPPFERPNDAEALGGGLAKGRSKWPTGVFAGWFPIKTPGTAARVAEPVIRKGFAEDALLAQFTAFPIDGESLAGGGLIVCNPPWGTEALLSDVCRALQRSYGEGADWAVDRLSVSEHARPRARRLSPPHEGRS